MPATATTAAPPTQAVEEARSSMDMAISEEHADPADSDCTSGAETHTEGGSESEREEAADEAETREPVLEVDEAWYASAVEGDHVQAPAPYDHLHAVLINKASRKFMLVYYMRFVAS